MFVIEGDELRVHVLDPQSDQRYLGSRYCVGGYIWQIEDRTLGALLTGPQFPSPEPDTYHGQGAPDMFLKTLGGETARKGDRVGVIGVGAVLHTTETPFHVSSNRQVIDPITWQVSTGKGDVTMNGAHRHVDWVYELERKVTLEGRTIHLKTSLKNSGTINLPLTAFAHPFFPPVRTGKLCNLSAPLKAFENPGFELGTDGWITQRAGHDWVNGAYQMLEYQHKPEHLTIRQTHDLLGEVTTQFDFVPDRVAIWGNDRTFSFEPYIERDLAPADVVQWTVSYRF